MESTPLSRACLANACPSDIGLSDAIELSDAATDSKICLAHVPLLSGRPMQEVPTEATYMTSSEFQSATHRQRLVFVLMFATQYTRADPMSRWPDEPMSQ